MPRWWLSALYDTCSLITLNLLVQWDDGFRQHFGAPAYVAECLAGDNLRPETQAGLRSVVGTPVEPPGPLALAGLLGRARLSSALADADLLVYATAVHHGMSTVTADKALARALCAAGLPVGNCALILQALVVGGDLTEADCDAALAHLVGLGEFLGPQNCVDLSHYQFP